MIANKDFDIKYAITSKTVCDVVTTTTETLDRQGMLLPRQVDEINKTLLDYGLVMSPKGQMHEVCDDMMGAPETTIDLSAYRNHGTVEQQSYDPILFGATVHDMTWKTIYENGLLKPSLHGLGRIEDARRTVTSRLPKVRGVDTSKYIGMGTYRFIVGSREMNNMYKYGDPTPRGFKALSPEAYEVAKDIMQTKIKGMEN